MVWCDVVWCGVVWCGVVWRGASPPSLLRQLNSSLVAVCRVAACGKADSAPHRGSSSKSHAALTAVHSTSIPYEVSRDAYCFARVAAAEWLCELRTLVPPPSPFTVPAARFFEDEITATSRKHDEAGLLSMANMGVPNSNGSQFFFSMRGDDMQHLDGKHTVFAKVGEADGVCS